MNIAVISRAVREITERIINAPICAETKVRKLRDLELPVPPFLLEQWRAYRMARRHAAAVAAGRTPGRIGRERINDGDPVAMKRREKQRYKDARRWAKKRGLPWPPVEMTSVDSGT